MTIFTLTHLYYIYCIYSETLVLPRKITNLLSEFKTVPRGNSNPSFLSDLALCSQSALTALCLQSPMEERSWRARRGLQTHRRGARGQHRHTRRELSGGRMEGGGLAQRVAAVK